MFPYILNGEVKHFVPFGVIVIYVTVIIQPGIVNRVSIFIRFYHIAHADSYVPIGIYTPVKYHSAIGRILPFGIFLMRIGLEADGTVQRNVFIIETPIGVNAYPAFCGIFKKAPTVSSHQADMPYIFYIVSGTERGDKLGLPFLVFVSVGINLSFLPAYSFVYIHILGIADVGFYIPRSLCEPVGYSTLDGITWLKVGVSFDDLKAVCGGVVRVQQGNGGVGCISPDVAFKQMMLSE